MCRKGWEWSGGWSPDEEPLEEKGKLKPPRVQVRELPGVPSGDSSSLQVKALRLKLDSCTGTNLWPAVHAVCQPLPHPLCPEVPILLLCPLICPV